MQTYLKPYVLRAGVIVGIVGATVLLLSLVPFVGLCLSFLAWIVFVVAGVFAAMWGRPAGALTTMQQGAIDGAIAGGIAGTIAYVVKWGADIVLAVLGALAFGNDSGSILGFLIQVVILGLVRFVVGIVVAAILGAAGGLIYNAIQQQQNKPTV